MTNKNKQLNLKSLRFLSPKLYNYITDILQETYNIHSYDLQMDAEQKEDGLQVIIRYGETFSHKQANFFTHEQIDNLSNEILDFVNKTGEACTEVLIDDYFKIYAP
ncbi:hypothetical protein [Ornithinibacillus halotolerans]|uniref:Uncharacterized protein n=1 Tax=Ornithinibacillus halotolerans TaxID=1274357 RepID=A0A916S3Y3_9BACI|nr:hypothetical protein [Ornithinibacillus halotolerans]GGA81650.1 hypothetical protein GCM10008025_26180 [Ornithinibacillus halotolerans]